MALHPFELLIADFDALLRLLGLGFKCLDPVLRLAQLHGKRLDLMLRSLFSSSFFSEAHVKSLFFARLLLKLRVQILDLAFKTVNLDYFVNYSRLHVRELKL